MPNDVTFGFPEGCKAYITCLCLQFRYPTSLEREKPWEKCRQDCLVRGLDRRPGGVSAASADKPTSRHHLDKMRGYPALLSSLPTATKDLEVSTMRTRFIMEWYVRGFSSSGRLGKRCRYEKILSMLALISSAERARSCKLISGLQIDTKSDLNTRFPAAESRLVVTFLVGFNRNEESREHQKRWPIRRNVIPPRIASKTDAILCYKRRRRLNMVT